MRIPYTKEQDRLILAAIGRAELRILAERIGRTWTALQARQNILRRRERAEQGLIEKPTRTTEKEIPARPQRPAWFEENAEAMMRAGR